MDYEHVPFKLHKCHEHGHLFKDCTLNKLQDIMKTNTGKNSASFTKMGGKGKGGKKYQKEINKEKQPSHNNFKILEEEGGNNGMNQ